MHRKFGGANLIAKFNNNFGYLDNNSRPAPEANDDIDLSTVLSSTYCKNFSICNVSKPRWFS